MTHFRLIIDSMPPHKGLKLNEIEYQIGYSGITVASKPLGLCGYETWSEAPETGKMNVETFGVNQLSGYFTQSSFHVSYLVGSA